MKIYIMTDLEGVSGIVTFEQTRDKDKNPHLYQEARRLLMEDVNAVVEGCLEGGADEVVVLDGHGGGFNFIPSEMHPGATYITGVDRGMSCAGLDESYDGVVLLGYHAMNGTPNGILHHTQSSKGENRYWYNGVESGEIAQSAAAAGHFGVPVIMVTGDAAACEEAKRFLGEEVVTVETKEGYGRQFGKLLAPAFAHVMLREAASRAVKNIPNCKPYTIEFPATVRVQFGSKEIADRMQFKKAKRVDDVTFEATIDNAFEMVRF